MDNLVYHDPNEAPFYHFEEFSCSYVSLFMFVVLVLVSLKKDLSIFMRMGSIGAVCVTSLIIFVVSYSVYSISNTEFKFVIDAADISPE
jgi:amino acid permease